MVTIAQIVKKIVSDRPMLHESMRQGIVSYGALAEKLKAQVEAELGKGAKESAIVMALRRYYEQISAKPSKKITSLFGSDIIMKSGIADIAVVKSPSLATKLEKLYKIVNFSKGDILNLVHGNYEVSIITNEKHMRAVLKVLESENIILKEKKLAAIAMSISQEQMHTPGIIFLAVRKLAWDNVNIVEIVSTTTELIFIISEKDATRAYDSLHELSKSE